MNEKMKAFQKTIIFPEMIGDWTNYRLPKKSSDSLRTPLYNSHHLTDAAMNQVLMLHQTAFDHFFNQLSDQLNTPVVIQSLTIQQTTHESFVYDHPGDMHSSRFQTPHIDPIDFVACKKTVAFLTHRLLGGGQAPDDDTPTQLACRLMPIISQPFFQSLTHAWRHLFDHHDRYVQDTFAHYSLRSGQQDHDPIIDICASFRLFNDTDLSCRVLYSSKTMHHLLEQFDGLSQTINETVQLSESTLTQSRVDSRCVLGSATLSLSDLDNLEVGDVITLDNQPIDSPISLTIDSDVQLNVMPIELDANKIGVQIVDLPAHEAYKADQEKPMVGPLDPFHLDKEPMEDATAASSDDDDVATHDDDDALISPDPLSDFDDTDKKEASMTDDDNFSWDDLDE